MQQSSPQPFGKISYISDSPIQNNPAVKQIFSLGIPDPVEFVDAVVRQTVDFNASDVLFEPRRDDLLVRVRIDGVLYEMGRASREVFENVCARIKVLSGLDTTEKRRVQEGQFTIEHDGRIVNLRVEVAQTIYGEMVVMRIHERQNIVMNLADLGFNPDAYTTYEKLLEKRSGLILVCGPTGCGKTTTLYSTIVKLNEGEKFNVMTVEDPVEFQLDGVNQMQTQAETGFTFAVGLKTMLRLSPDIVLVGEIRDKETAEIAVESGLTGQLVLSTLHAEDAVGALFRMLDLGIESYLLNSSLSSLISQRLIRKNCRKCLVEYEPSDEEKDVFLKVIGKVPTKLTKSKGCEACKNLGFRGRTGIYEVLTINSSIRDMVRRKVSEDELRMHLIRNGFITLIRDGLLKCEQGITTVPEVLRNSLRSY